MAQAVLISHEVYEAGSARDEALAVCKNCGHLVPRTMMCLYCGAPILFRKPRRI